jgi:hypothetical protein
MLENGLAIEFDQALLKPREEGGNLPQIALFSQFEQFQGLFQTSPEGLGRLRQLTDGLEVLDEPLRAAGVNPEVGRGGVFFDLSQAGEVGGNAKATPRERRAW